MADGEFNAVVRLCENDTKFVTFTRNEIPHLFNVLDHQKSVIEFEFESNDKWWSEIVGEAPTENTSIHFQHNEYPERSVYEIGNKRNTTYPFYIMLGANSIQTLYERNKLVWKMVNEVKTNFVRKLFSDLVRDAKYMRDDISDHVM